MRNKEGEPDVVSCYIIAIETAVFTLFQKYSCSVSFSLMQYISKSIILILLCCIVK